MAKRRVVESRRTERLHAGWRVLIKDRSGESAEGRISDVSPTGLRFSAPFEYRRAERVSLDIIISPKNFVRTRIVIVREEGSQNGIHTYGARFIDMTKLDRALLGTGMDVLESEDQDQIPPTPIQSRNRGFRDLIAWFRGL